MGLWYKDFYLTTKQGEKDIIAALNDPIDGGPNRTDIENRLSEMKAVVAAGRRCTVTENQVKFLERILANAQQGSAG